MGFFQNMGWFSKPFKIILNIYIFWVEYIFYVKLVKMRILRNTLVCIIISNLRRKDFIPNGRELHYLFILQYILILFKQFCRKKTWFFGILGENMNWFKIIFKTAFHAHVLTQNTSCFVIIKCYNMITFDLTYSKTTFWF